MLMLVISLCVCWTNEILFYKLLLIWKSFFIFVNYNIKIKAHISRRQSIDHRLE